MNFGRAIYPTYDIRWILLFYFKTLLLIVFALAQYVPMILRSSGNKETYCCDRSQIFRNIYSFQGTLKPIAKVIKPNNRQSA